MGSGSEFFEASGGGDPAVFQHMWWLLGHPSIYVWLIPAVAAIVLAFYIFWKRRVRRDWISQAFIASAAVFAIAGFGVGIQMFEQGIDYALHDTYFVIAHLQYTLRFALIFIAFAFFYFFFERIIGAAYSRWLAALHWITASAGLALFFAPQYLLGSQGMPRRDRNYERTIDVWNQVSHIGYIVTLISVVIFAICLIESISRRIRNGNEPDAQDVEEP